MAFIGLKVPAPEAARLLSLPVPPGSPLTAGEMHITLLYLGKGVPVVSTLGAVMGCHTVAARWKPFRVHAALLTSFPAGEDGVPVIVRVVSEELMAFQAQLKAAMERMSVPFSDKYPEYKPHVTLTYANEAVQPTKVGPVSWDVGEVTVWGGEEMDKVVSATVYMMG